MKNKNPYLIFADAEKKRTNSKFRDAVLLYEKARDNADNDRELQLNCLLALGDTFRLTGHFDKALKNYKTAHKLSLKIEKDINKPNPYGVPSAEEIIELVDPTDAVVGIGLSLRGLGKHKEALKYLNVAVRTYTKQKDKEGLAFSLWARGGAYRVKGDITKAINDFKEAKKIFAQLRDKAGRGYTLAGLGGATRVQGKYKDSYKNYSEANKIFSDINDTFGMAYTSCGIANSLRMRDEYRESLNHFAEARKKYKKIGDRVSYAYTLWAEGISFLMLDRITNANDNFKEAEKLFKATKDNRGIVYCTIASAQTHFISKKKALGLRLAKKALTSAAKYEFKIEKGYANKVIKAMEKKPATLPINLA